MGSAKTIYFTYILGDNSITGGTANSYQLGKSLGYSPAIHCNYIAKLETNSIANKSIDFIVPDGSLLPFMNDSSQIATGQKGYGWSASKLFGVIQICDGTGHTGVSTTNTSVTGLTIFPDPNGWKIIDLTNQLNGYPTFSGTTIPKAAFNTSTFIQITVSQINAAPQYNLGYLLYPNALPIDNDKLTFGEEAFFFGNVKTDIKAIAYTTDISVVLPLNQYNSTTNPTWDSLSPVSISEVGVFDDNNTLVAIGKLNNPISKDSTIFRTIQFSLDF